MKKIANKKENNYLWKLYAICDGCGWNRTNQKPCYQLWEIDASDIRYRKYFIFTSYGFVCPECGSFSEIPNDIIPFEVKSNAKPYTPIIRKEQQSGKKNCKQK